MNQIQLRSEELVLYALLTRADRVHDIMSRVSTDMFLDPKHKVIFQSAVDLYVEQEPISSITVFKSILKQKSMYKHDAQVEVSQLIGKFNMLSPTDIEDAVIYLIAESVRCEHESVGEKILHLSQSDSYDPKDVISYMQEHILNNKFTALLNKKEKTNEDIVLEVDEAIERAASNDGITGLESGYSQFDRITGGLKPGNFMILGARPAMGKSAMAIGFCVHNSIAREHRGVLFNCEMTPPEIAKRIICVDGQIPGYSIKYGQLNSDEQKAYTRAKNRFIASNLRILSGSWKINQIVAKCHELKNKEGLEYVVVDYLQLVGTDNPSNRNNEVEEVTRKLKLMANELQIPVMALSQLSRALEQRVDKKPMLSDLRDSGAIEQDADIVTFLFRPAYYMEQSEREGNPMEKDGWLIIAKHRDGELRDVQLKFEETIPAWLDRYAPEPKPVVQGEINFDSPTAIQPSSSFESSRVFDEDDDMPF